MHGQQNIKTLALVVFETYVLQNPQLSFLPFSATDAHFIMAYILETVRHQ